jgi:outer membrane protein OmpA-like peptidoglycan-associated protein
MRTVAALIAFAFALGSAQPDRVEAQFLKRVKERVKQTAAERKTQTEENVLTRATEPADSLMSKVSSPVESLAARVGGEAGAAVGRLGRGNASQSEEEGRLRQELATGRAALPAVQFQPGTGVIDPASEPSLRALTVVITGSPSVFLIQGRADAGSSPEVASELANARATAVKNWLVGNGIPGAQVFAAGDGVAASDAPLVSVVLMQ